MARFLFAINTISMVKNDALFSYIAPSNIFAWLLMPLRYCMPLKQFVWMNRIIIKATHFPVLFCIYMYERFWLAPSMYEPTDLVENPGRGRVRSISFADPAGRGNMFSPNIRVREESVAGFQKDRALEEVFRRIPAATTLRTQRRHERRKTQTAIRNWMDQNDDEGGSPGQWPSMDSRAMPEWQRRLSMGWERPPTHLRQVSDLRSAASDPADLLSNAGASSLPNRAVRSSSTPLAADYKDHTDADGDDELVTNDEDEEDGLTNTHTGKEMVQGESEEDYFTTPMTTRFGKLPSSLGSSNKLASATPRPAQPKRGPHKRTMSTNTILYDPEIKMENHEASSSPPKSGQRSRTSTRAGPSDAPPTPARRSSPRRSSPRRTVYLSNAKPRPILPPKGLTDAGASRAIVNIDNRPRPRDMRRLSSVDMSILSDNTNLLQADDPNAGLAGSFQTQMAMAMMKDNRLRGGAGVESADRDRMGRLVLARMKTLEESFADVVREMRDLKYSSTAPATRRNSSGEELRTAPLVEIAGRERGAGKRTKGDASPRKPVMRRPGSRRSNKEARFGPPLDGKGKGKEVIYSSDEEDEDHFAQKGSSL